jgi:hypothetical protein
MSEQMREEFEAWFRAKHYWAPESDPLVKDEAGEYYMLSTFGKWRAWQASRESLPSAYTAVDMTTAAAQWFRDGVASKSEPCDGCFMADAEALRKDAERYRWTSIEGNWVARMFGKWRAHVGAYGDVSPTEWYETREEAIDAAMSKEG